MLPTGEIGTFGGSGNESSIVKSFFGKKTKVSSSDGILQRTIEQTFGKANRYVRDSIHKMVSNEDITISEVGTHIEKIKDTVASLLPSEVSTEENLEDISYASYLYWVFKKMKKAGFSLNRKKFKKVPEEHGSDVYNILQDKALTTFFMLAKGFGILDFTKNNFEVGEKENEIKVLDTSFDEVKNGLEKWGKNDKSLSFSRHRDARIIDHYYDDRNLRLDRQKISDGKRSIRIRTKQYDDGTSEDFYTIKRKITLETGKEEARECYEKEYKINKKGKFKNFLRVVGFKNSRSKNKDRKSFSIDFEYNGKMVHAKIDIDKYEGIDEFIEIECNDNEAIGYIIDKLNLKKSDGSEKDTLIGGSRELFRYYDIYEQYVNHYNVDEETGKVTWDHGDVGNINAAPQDMLAA